MVKYEYEFRLVVQSPSSFDQVFKQLGFSTKRKVVYYAKPHFRFKDKKFEIKRVQSVESVYHDTVWFKWVCSIETPFDSWKKATLKNFCHKIGNFQQPLTIETRDFVQIDSQAQLYAFRNDAGYNLVFEWEYGTFKKPLTDFNYIELCESLSKYKHIYDTLSAHSAPPYRLNERAVRKPVTCVSEIPEGNQYLYAHKLDGNFGLVYSYRDAIKEKWEGYECVIRNDVTLGDGFVFAAEKLAGSKVVLLDVYQVRGQDVAGWCRRRILTEFLPTVRLFEGYFVQTYVSDKNELESRLPLFETDGVIIHDVEKDAVFKFKTENSIDLVYFKGYFHLPNGRIKCLDENLENGRVYEISTENGRVVRKRTDRFKGNSAAQIQNVFALGWHGPPVEYEKKKRSLEEMESVKKNKKSPSLSGSGLVKNLKSGGVSKGLSFYQLSEFDGV